MQNIVELTFVGDSTSGIGPKKHISQTVEIAHNPDIVCRGVDGRESLGHVPSTIRWFGGTKSDLQGITDVRIVDSRGAVLIDGYLNCHFRVIREIDGWVTFDVLQRE